MVVIGLSGKKSSGKSTLAKKDKIMKKMIETSNS